MLCRTLSLNLWDPGTQVLVYGRIKMVSPTRGQSSFTQMTDDAVFMKIRIFLATWVLIYMNRTTAALQLDLTDLRWTLCNSVRYLAQGCIRNVSALLSLAVSHRLRILFVVGREGHMLVCSAALINILQSRK